MIRSLCFCWLLCFGIFAAEPKADPKELPRISPTEPSQALRTFELKPGFHLELAAAEPLVMDPIAIAFDEKGRMFAVEMRDYSERRAERLGRIRVLEDTDGDGIYDKSTIYVDQLPWPTAVICYNGGIFVGATPDILYCKDTKGDGHADVREKVFTGFASQFAPYDPKKLNVQQLFNSFTWGLDNRIHGAEGGNGGKIIALKHPELPAVDLRGRDFSFDPRSLTLRAESGGGQYGLAFDNAGRKFVCSNSSHIRQVLYELRYAEMNRFYTPPPPSIDIAVEGPAAEIFRISPDEPWRVLRTRWRVAGLVSGPVEGGGRPSGYFSAATGITIYRGDAWPSQYRGNAFVADCGGNLVHRKRLWKEGVLSQAARPDEEKRSEFLASRDNWFRPVQLANGPDGNLYVIDMYREVIEHPWSLPESIKKYLDLNSGNDRGRIYRIAADGQERQRVFDFANATPEKCVAALASENGWTRDTAARLLFERQDQAIAADLKHLAARSPSHWARLHALYALAGLGVLSREDLERALTDSAPEVRWHAIRLCERLKGGASSELTAKLVSLADDPDPEVRYQLAFTSAAIGLRDKISALERIIRRDTEDRWSRAAVLMACGSGGAELFGRLASNRAFVAKPGAAPFLNSLAEIVGTEQKPDAVRNFMRQLASADEPHAIAWAAAIERGMEKSGSSLNKSLDPTETEHLMSSADRIFSDAAAPSEERVAAIHLLETTDRAQANRVAQSGLAPQQPEEIQRASVQTLVRLGQMALLIDRWQELTPRLRAGAIEVGLQREDRTETLLHAIESGKVRASDLSIQERARLRDSRSARVRELAAKVLGANPGAESREAVVKRFSPALARAGNAERGRLIFQQRCTSCHALAGEGHALGPDLSTVIHSGKEAVLTSILDPNREVNSKFLQYSIDLNDGDQLDGIILAENNQSLVLGMPNGGRTEILRRQIRQIKASGKSLMPEGLEEGLGTQDVADLLEYILHPGISPPIH